jgi:hypothetical protein
MWVSILILLHFVIRIQLARRRCGFRPLATFSRQHRLRHGRIHRARLAAEMLFQEATPATRCNVSSAFISESLDCMFWNFTGGCPSILASMA